MISKVSARPVFGSNWQKAARTAALGNANLHQDLRRATQKQTAAHNVQRGHLLTEAKQLMTEARDAAQKN